MVCCITLKVTMTSSVSLIISLTHQNTPVIRIWFIACSLHVSSFFLADNNKAVKHSRNTPNNIDCHTARPHFPDLVPPKQCDKQILGKILETNVSENNLRINNVQTFPRNSSYATQGDEGFNVVHNQSYYK